MQQQQQQQAPAGPQLQPVLKTSDAAAKAFSQIKYKQRQAVLKKEEMWRVTTSQQFRSAYEGPFVGSTGAEYLSLRAEPVVRGGSATYVIRCTGSGMMDNPVIIHITEQLARAFQEVLTQQQQTLGPNAQVPIPPLATHASTVSPCILISKNSMTVNLMLHQVRQVTTLAHSAGCC